MLRYLLIRIFSFFPALLLGILALFLFRQLGPGTSRWEEEIETQALQSGAYDIVKLQRAKAAIRQQLQLDLPAFYISFQSAALPVHAGATFELHEREWIRKVSVMSGQPKATIELALVLKNAKLHEWSTAGSLSEIFDRQQMALKDASAGARATARLLIQQIHQEASPRRAFLPRVVWNGTANQFHAWLTDLAGGDLGKSWKNNEEVSAVIARALLYSMRFTLPAFVLIFVTAYWAVSAMAGLTPRLKQAADRLLYFVDLFPLFGWSLLLMILFASGIVFSWFPSYVAGSSLTGASFWHRNIWPYILPVAALWLASFPYITKQIDQAFDKTALQPFVIAAHARGLSGKTVREKYRLHYALFPAITLSGEYLLAVLSGALVVEVLFSIPGIGKLMTDAVLTEDFPVVTGIVLLLMAARMASYLLTDVLYYWFDPRIRLGK